MRRIVSAAELIDLLRVEYPEDAPYTIEFLQEVLDDVESVLNHAEPD
jgi:hypothetical protein